MNDETKASRKGREGRKERIMKHSTTNIRRSTCSLETFPAKQSRGEKAKFGVPEKRLGVIIEE